MYKRSFNTALTYDDVQLIPQYSEVQSRRDVDLTAQLSTNFRLKLPYIASPMDTVCGYDMALKMMKLGAVGCLHRFMSIPTQSSKVYQLSLDAQTDEVINVWEEDTVPIMVAIGVGEEEFSRAASCIAAGANVILIDVAHGHHINVKRTIEMLIAYRVKTGKKYDIIAGNIATRQAAYDLIKWGVDGLRTGIGGGSMCTTRLETGHGVPNITTIQQCANSAMYAVNDEEGITTNDGTVPVIADGGIRRAGDIAKAIAAGADTVMLGSLLAGTTETPGNFVETQNGLLKRYRGSASLDTKVANKQESRNIEGESTTVPYKGGTKFVIKRLNDGLRSACSYSGASNLDDFRAQAEMYVVTGAGQIEAKPHLKI